MGVLGNDGRIGGTRRKHLGRNGGQRRHGHDADAGTMGKALCDGGGNAHADERARAIAQNDGIEIAHAQTRVGQHRVDHRHQQARVLARLFFVAFEHRVTVLQGHRAGDGRGIDREQFHAGAPCFSWALKKAATSSIWLVDGIGSRHCKNIRP